MIQCVARPIDYMLCICFLNVQMVFPSQCVAWLNGTNVNVQSYALKTSAISFLGTGFDATWSFRFCRLVTLATYLPCDWRLMAARTALGDTYVGLS